MLLNCFRTSCVREHIKMEIASREAAINIGWVYCIVGLHVFQDVLNSLALINTVNTCCIFWSSICWINNLDLAVSTICFDSLLYIVMVI